MQHYVCTGDCGSESEKPKVCESDGCSKEGQQFTECDCDDGLHHEVLSNEENFEIETMDDEDDL